ncbi:MAG: deoxyribonuclease V [Candidatus Thiodiazotropha sp.]|jgi:deoxyribonuclease V
MKPKINHLWHLTEPEAIRLQQSLATQVIKSDQLDEVRLVAGVDVAYEKCSNKLVAAVVVLDADTLNIIEAVTAQDYAQFPYISGLFSFRELPPLIKALAKLDHSPDLIVCDGQGYAHPRRFGLACHLGVIFDVPAIGCGKTKLLGEHNEPATERGATAPLYDKDDLIGSVVRTQNGIKPIYVSIGHRISLATACRWVLKLSPKYRLPETTRSADQLVNATISKKACLTPLGCD